MPDSAVTVWQDRQFIHHREVYEGNTQLLPELPIIGHLRVGRAMAMALRPDAHPGEYEVHLIHDGIFRLWVGSTENAFELRGGMACVTRPGEVHGGESDRVYPARWSWLRFVLSETVLLPGMDPERSHWLDHELSGCCRIFVASSDLLSAMTRLLAEHRTPTCESPLAARGILHELLARIVRDARPEVAEPAAVCSPAVRRALDWMDVHLAESIGVNDMAKAANLSESHFRRIFQRELGLSPSEYLLQKRLQKARELLGQTSLTVTDVAAALAFSTPAYFASVFRKMTGMTPTQYRVSVRD